MVGDSGDTDSGPVDTGESGDTDEVDTGDGELVALDVSPPALVVNPGAVYTLRVVGTDGDGVRTDATNAGFATSDSAIATVDAAGIVTAVAEGQATVTVTVEGLERAATVEVRDDGLCTVHVVDAITGEPVPGARVAEPATAGATTGSDGIATLSASTGGPLTFTAWKGETYGAVTVVGVVGRDVTLPLWPKDTGPRDATIRGDIDFSGVNDGTWEDLVVGFAAASIQGSLAALSLDDLFSDDRTVTVVGVDVDAPANLFVEGTVEDFEAVAADGPVAVWGLAGPIPIAEASENLSGTGDALALLIAHLDTLTWGQHTGGTASRDGAISLDLAPVYPFSGRRSVVLPPLSLGFQGGEDILVLVTEERRSEGFVATGLGLGDGSLDVQTVPEGAVSDSLGTAVLAYAQVGGLGTGGQTCSSVAREDGDGDLVFPSFLDVSTVDTRDAATRSLGVGVDSDAQFVRIRLVDRRNRVHDVLAPASWTGTLPTADTSFALAQAIIEVLAAHTTSGSFEEWLAHGAIDPDEVDPDSVARTVMEF